MTGAPRRRELLAVGAVVFIGLVLRLWSIGHGLPFVHNLDEYAHFVPGAVAMSKGTLNPHYFQNPPAFTYLLLVVFSVIWVLPGAPVGRLTTALDGDPTTLFLAGRVTAAVLGVVAVGLVYVAARRAFGVAAALAGALLLSVGFLPVFYSHFALNDVPTLAPVALGLVGVAGMTLRARRSDYVVAGLGGGAAAATKYTAAALVVAVGLAWLVRMLDAPQQRRAALRDLFAAAAAALAAFVVLNPFSVLDSGAFFSGVGRQQRLTADVGKVGLDDTTGWQYYAWTLTWGFGVVPCALAALGTVTALRRSWRRVLPFVGFVVATWLVIGAQTRFYARWFLPAYPALAVLAGVGFAAVVTWVTPRLRAVAVGVLGVVALAQPLVTVVHNDVVLGRTDTREQAKAWLLAHVDRGDKVVAELVSSPPYFNAAGRRGSAPLFDLYPQPRGAATEKYASTLSAATLDDYARGGFCVVVTGSTQRDRALKARVPGALAYYRALEERAQRVATFSPVARGTTLPGFNFDISYNWYPLRYVRPGPRIDVYRLVDPNCPAVSD